MPIRALSASDGSGYPALALGARMNPTGSRGCSNVKGPGVRCLVASMFWLAVSAATALPSPQADTNSTPIPQRIITIAPNSAEIICSLGAGDRIVGVSKFCTYPPELSDRTRVGGLFDPNLERILALRPDLVVLRGQNDAVSDLCREHGIRRYVDRTESLPDVEACIRELGRLLGRSERADAMVSKFQARLDAVRRRVAGQRRPRVLLTVSRRSDRLANILTTGKGTFLDQMLDIAGGVNAFGHVEMAYPQISPEAILARRPDVIIELMPEERFTPEIERQMREQWRALGPIPAITGNHIWFVTDDNGLIPSPRYVEIVEKVSRMLHPIDATSKGR